MSDYGDLISQSYGRSSPALPLAVGNIDEDPDKAARAMDLARVTGAPASAIYGDLDEFERQHKAIAASDIIANNPQLGDFIQSNPMVPKLANDDYGNLDAVSQKISQSWLPKGLRQWLDSDSIAQSLAKGFGDAPIGYQSITPWEGHPVATSLAAAAVTVPEVFFRSVNAAITAASDIVAQSGDAISPGLGRDLGAMLEAEAMGLTGRGHPAKPAMDVYSKVRPWIENGKEPPPGVLPEFDKARAEQNVTDLDQLKDITQEAQKSTTRERAPDLFKQFIAQHTDAEIGISGEAVAALYGDKVPLADDGLLGWVPGIADKLELAKSTGDDVRIPLADWVTHVDPKVMDALHDDIRVRPNGITARETQALQEYLQVKGYHGSPAEFNQFSNDKIGSGEGAQAYGYGHYIAENQKVAEKYRDKLSKGTEGNLYQTIIDHEREDFLDWDKELSQQPNVLNKIPKDFRNTLEEWLADYDQSDDLGDYTGKQLYKMLERYASEEALPGDVSEGGFAKKEVADYLHRIGIPGTKYLDELSRKEVSPENQTQNFVVFDPNKIEITHKNNVPLGGEVPATRDAAGLEPMLSVGDRRLALEKMDRKPQPYDSPEFAPHDFKLLDEKGNPVGYINLTEMKGGKDLYVDMISGLNGLGPQDFGPRLMIDLLRQIKEQFPNAERIGGARVTGAREKAGKAMDMPDAWINLDVDAEGYRIPQGWGTAEPLLREILEGGKWEQFSPSMRAYIKPHFDRTPEQRQLAFAVQSELAKIVPQKVTPKVVDKAELQPTTTGSGVAPGRRYDLNGVYIRFNNMYPILAVSLDSGNALGTARHEAIHHLRNYGFFDKTEWATLEKAAIDNGWLDKFNVHTRYPAADLPLKLEEAIADGYAKWNRGEFTPPPETLTIFQKMKQFFDAIKERISQMLGKDATWEDIFQRVDTGEIGSREGTRPLDPRSFDERASIAEPPEGGSRVFERAAALGMTVDQFKAYDKLIQQRHAEDIAAATKRAETEKARELTKEWKSNRADLRKEVAESIRNRPDVAVDLFLAGDGLYGRRTKMAYKLDAAALSEKQKAMLPPEYYGKDGLNPDDVANLFGYGSGEAMVDKLAAYNVNRRLAGMSSRDYVNRITDIETDRQMKLKYGVLEDNIMDAVNEQVTGETQQNILHEETVKLGMEVGAAPLDKAAILKGLRDQFAKMPLASVDSAAYMKAAGKAGRNAELALLNNDPAAAFQAKQQQYYATVIANEASKLEKDLGKFDKLAKRFSKREVTGIDPAYTNFIHDILQRVGKPVRRSIQDIATEIGAGEFKSLQDFVEGKNGFYLREVAVADMLYDPAFRKKFESLTVDEFRAVNDSIKSLVKNGRDEQKITKAGVEADLGDIKSQMIEQLERFQEKTYDAKGGRWMGPIPPKVAKLLRSYGAAHIQIENLFNRWDHDDPNGVFQQYVMRDLVDAANSEAAMEKRYAAKLRELDDKADLKKLVDNTLFKVPGTDQLMKLNRGNLRAIILNLGNESNMSKLARGYKIEPAQLWAWVHQHAEKADWDWAQKMGDVFAELKGEADIMYRQLSGVAPESIEIKPVQTPHGTYKGWYYPIIYHPEFEGPSKKLMGKDALEGDGYVRATVANSYTKARTGYAGPMALDLDMMPARMKQMIHDISMRPSIINASKIFYDKDVRSAIFTRFGGEWRDMLVPYLVDVANAANYVPKDQRMFMQASEFLRQNLVSTLVGLNPGTVMKHGPTAAVQSLHEVGPINFLKALKGMFSIDERTGESNWNFAMKTSEELQRRHQNYVETLGGATDLLQPTSGYAGLRSTVQRFSSAPVALSDLLSAVPTWLAQYEKTLGEGATHGDAVYMADRAVRRAHGSVAVTNRSAVMRTGPLGAWFASVYGFFNHIMNRQYELLWKSGETLGMAKDGEYKAAMQRAPELTSMLFAYVLAPALIEEMVTPLASSDNESWGKKAAKGIAFTLGASWVGIRDIANAMLNGRDPSVGLISTAGKTVTDFARDLNKQGPFNKEHAGKIVKDGATLLGALTGVVPTQVGRAAQFSFGVATGTERPKGPWGWLVGARYGTLNKHSKTFDEWQRHH